MSITRVKRVRRINEMFRNLNKKILLKSGERMRCVIGAKELESERGESDKKGNY